MNTNLLEIEISHYDWRKMRLAIRLKAMLRFPQRYTQEQHDNAAQEADLLLAGEINNG